MIIVTFNSKEDYERVYNNYPHSYLMNMFKNMCSKNRNYIYVNKAPSPEDVIWGNLEFDKEKNYFKNLFIKISCGLVYLIISFAIQIEQEFLNNTIEDKLDKHLKDYSKIFSILVDIVVSLNF